MLAISLWIEDVQEFLAAPTPFASSGTCHTTHVSKVMVSHVMRQPRVAFRVWKWPQTMDVLKNLSLLKEDRLS